MVVAKKDCQTRSDPIIMIFMAAMMVGIGGSAIHLPNIANCINNIQYLMLD